MTCIVHANEYNYGINIIFVIYIQYTYMYLGRVFFVFVNMTTYFVN